MDRSDIFSTRKNRSVFLAYFFYREVSFSFFFSSLFPGLDFGSIIAKIKTLSPQVVYYSMWVLIMIYAKFIACSEGCRSKN